MNKKNTTRRSLLVSALMLLVCTTMFVGSTFAWFTDSVTSSNNKIQSGTLKLDLELLEEDGWVSIKESNQAIFDYENWEPGYTDVKVLRITNKGTLALKWLAKFTSETKLSDLANVIDVYVKTGVKEQPQGRSDIADWTKVGTVSEFVNTIEETTNGSLLPEKSEYLGIALKMQESAGNEYQNLNLGGAFDIQILATQYTSESDSFNNQYDANAKYDVDIWDGKTATAPVADADGVYHITTAAELVGMMNVTGNSIYKGKTIVLDNNIDLGGRTVKGIGGISDNFAGVFDGQGYTISNFKVDSTENSFYAGLFNQVSHGGTIKNLTVKNATIVGNSMVGAVASSLDDAVIDNCKAIDCTLIGVKKVGAVVGYSAGSTVTNNYAENCTVIYSEKEGGDILGYEYTGSTVSNNTANNVSVKQGVAVSSADELVALGGTKINGNYILTADIDMTGKAMKSMEISGGAVVNFDGNGHTISNLNLGAAKLYGMTGEGNEVAGLFDLSAPATTVSLTVSDLTVKNATVSCSGFAAAIVGYNSNGGTVITLNNVDVDGATVTADSVAALVAYSTGKVNLNNCDVKGLTLTGEAGRPEKVGAYIGTACTASCVVTVTNCTNGTTYNNYGRVINGATYN